MKLEEAENITHELLDADKPLNKHFKKFMVCGSIRRKRENVNDIDIVAIPKSESEYSFGDESLNTTIQKLDPEGRNQPQEEKRYLLGDKLKRFMYKGIMVEIYLANEKTFETLVLIRTGSKEHNIRLTTLAKGQGLKLKADGSGLCKMKGGIYNNEPEEIAEIIDNTENGILMKLLNNTPKPEERNW